METMVARPRARWSSERSRSLGGWLAVWLAVLGATFAVGAAPRLLAAPVPECTGAQSLSFGCLAGRYEALTARSGADAALMTLESEREANSYLRLGCHQMTHTIGRTAGARHGLAAFKDGSDLCASGYYHGVTEAVMTGIGPGRILDEARTVCADLRETGDRSYLHYNCVHGMGHGFMSVFGNDIVQALSGCDRLAESWEQQFCHSGVFMENMSAIGDPARPSTDLRPGEPLYPCTAVDDRYKAECYLKQTAYALYLVNGDFGAVFKLCRETGDAAFRGVCDQGLGGDAAIMSSKYVIGSAAQALTIRELCLLGSDSESRSNCVVGAVTTIVRDLAGDDAKARALCAALEGELSVTCELTRVVASQGVPAPAGAHHHH
jgi:hypothetical protein